MREGPPVGRPGARSCSDVPPDRATLGIIAGARGRPPGKGSICAVAGFFVLGIILGPVAIVCGWLAMGRSWTGSRPVPALVALVLGAIDTLLAHARPAPARPGPSASRGGLLE
ncbi:hypothetical protein [Streptomyces lincolnensis]|uniref:hypothetical protein n=1 Tax=Streptomyces lincolnensis TaxID=1915 RepID=UPI0037D1C692